jgi:TRAP-type C4-dicarboxylate transport system permease small subunit
MTASRGDSPDDRGDRSVKSTLDEASSNSAAAADLIDGLPEAPDETSSLQGRRWIPERILEHLGAVVILVLTVFIAVTVVMRYIGHGVLGSVELSALAMVVITVLVAPAAVGADDNFKVEIVDMFNRPTWVTACQVLGAVVQLIVAVFLTFSSMDLMLRDLDTKTTMAGELSLPRYYLSICVFVGFVCMLHASVLYLIRDISRLRQTRKGDE